MITIEKKEIVFSVDDSDEEKNIILKMEEDGDEDETNVVPSNLTKKIVEPIYLSKIADDFKKCTLVKDIKKQNIYLSHMDEEISFDEGRHVYLLHDKSKEFAISVTGFCKKEIHNNEFNGPKIIRNMNMNEEDDEYDMHVLKAIEWKYSALFGSLFHAIIEYFFDNIVNKCSHDECRNQSYNKEAYYNSRIDDTHRYYMSINKLSQTIIPSEKFPLRPRMPCLYTLEYYESFIKTILCYDNFVEFFKNNSRFNIDGRLHKKDILKTMEHAFFILRSPLSKSVINYRRIFVDVPFETSIDNIIRNKFGIGTYLSDLESHMESFRNVLIHLPLKECCDIRPEYIVFNEEQGLAGSVDLTMRSRIDPDKLFVYDWKTCKKIFNSFRRNNAQTIQLFDYSCQLHTYANLINKNSKYDINLFVVNITHTDSCIYNVKNYMTCMCGDIFSKFKKSLVSL